MAGCSNAARFWPALDPLETTQQGVLAPPAAVSAAVAVMHLASRSP
jgi:hypothetical protein